jgi:hypothetical protein
MHTQEHARTLWCPFARVFTDRQAVSNAAINRGEGVTLRTHTRCLAADCMAWRWEELVETDRVSEDRLNEKLQQPLRGYCGLAGYQEPEA